MPNISWPNLTNITLIRVPSDTFCCLWPKAKDLLLLFLLDVSFQKLIQPLSRCIFIIFSIFFFFFFLLFSITISIFHSIIYVYLPRPTYLCLPTYINIPTNLQLPIYVYLPTSTYLPTYLKHTYLWQPTNLYQPMSTYLPLPTYLPSNVNTPTYLCPLTNTYQPMSTYLPVPIPTYHYKTPQTREPVSVLLLYVLRSWVLIPALNTICLVDPNLWLLSAKWSPLLA